ncbi:hypothetical protein D3C71_1892770 [compost metagenome]
MKLPASSSSRFTTSRNIHGDRPCSLIQPARFCGILSLVSRKENSTALVMMYSSIADMLAESISTLGTCFQPMSLYTNSATAKAYTADIAAASVAVKMPE